jgi:hypothetical protein
VTVLQAAPAQVRVDFGPGEADPGPPFYARITETFVAHTDQWAAIVFYRQPGCVPPTFNLLTFFNPPSAFGCPLTVEGFLVYNEVPPPPGAAPKQAKLFGLGAVPVWFVSWPELQGAMADGALTITELAALPSLRVGSAGFFRETLHPSPTLPGSGARVTHLTIVASGTLPQGQSFFLQVAAQGENLMEVKNVIIQFR